MALSLKSMSLRNKPKISDAEFKELRDFIYDYTGIDIPARRKYLMENRLGSRLEELKLKNYGEYFKFIKFSPGKAKELEKLCEKITTNETSFFRDMRQLGVFKTFVCNEIITKSQSINRKQMNIWCAGCSSGEEPYTLSMLLHEVLKMGIMSWNIKITANDLSMAMVNKAKRGLYNDYSFKTTPKDMIAKYFTKEANGYRISPKIKRLISFGPINLNDRMAVKRVPRSHVIFCRNVIIYFDQDMKKRVIQSFYDNLLPGGYLVLGHSESIHNLSSAFKPIVKPGGIVYQRQA